MRIPFWRILIFAAVIILVTYAVFPSPTNMLQHYWKSGKYIAARDLLPDILQQDQSPSVLRLAANIYQALGEPDKAIETLTRLQQKQPGNRELLQTLAQYLEWNLETQKAAEIYERLVALEPEDMERRDWLINYYRLQGQQQLESLSIARIIPHLGERASALSETFIPLLWGELLELAKQRRSQGPAPLRDYLMQRLYIIWQEYEIAIEEDENPVQSQFVTYALEYFVEADALEQGKRLAAALDEKFRSGIENRLTLATFMSWKGLQKEVLAYLTSIENDAPNDKALLLALTSSAMDTGELGLAKARLEKLVELEPDNVTYRQDLARLSVATQDYPKALTMLASLLEMGMEPAPILQEMLAVSQWSDSEAIMRQALEEVERHPVENPGVDRGMAQVYLSLDEPDKAFKLLQKLAKESGSQEDLGLMLDAAVYSSKEQYLDSAFQTLDVFTSLDTETMRRLAEAYLAAERPDKAFPLLREVVQLEGTDSDYLRLLQAANYQADIARIQTAVELALERQKASPALAENPDFELALAQGYLALEQPDKAYPLFMRMVERSQGGEGLDQLLDAAIFSANATFIDETRNVLERYRPMTPVLMRKLAEAYLSAERPDKAFPLLLEVVQAEERPEDLVRLLEAAAFANDKILAQRATAVAERLLRKDPKAMVVAKAPLLSLYMWGENPLEAARMLARMSDDNPGNLALALNTAQAYSNAEMLEEAIFYYERAAAISPNNSKVLGQLAAFYGYVNANEKMIATYERLLALDKLGYRGRIALGRAYADSQQWELALPLLTGLLDRERLPQYEGMMLARSMVYAGQREQAKDVYRRLAEENPGDVAFLSRLGAEALYDDEMAVAKEFFLLTLRLDATNPRALKGLAMIAAANNDADRAIANYNRYNAIYPDDPESRFQLGELYSIEEYPDEAAKQYDKVLRLIRRTGNMRPPNAPRENAAEFSESALRTPGKASSQPQEVQP